jgi:hypothetical protein
LRKIDKERDILSRERERRRDMIMTSIPHNGLLRLEEAATKNGI